MSGALCPFLPYAFMAAWEKVITLGNHVLCIIGTALGKLQLYETHEEVSLNKYIGAYLYMQLWRNTVF